MIQIKDIRKSYGDFEAVRGIDISVEEGEIYTLLGSNGAGKTTLIKILVGLLEPTSGEALIDGRPARDISEVRGEFGYMPEHPELYGRLTGSEFLQTMGTLKDVEEVELSKKIQKFGEEFELTEHMKKEMRSYSKGMKQKILFLNALINDPPNLVLDEPTSSLDPRFSQEMKTRIKELADKGKCILMSTHITPVAEDLADRVGIIERGELVAEGNVKELMDRTGSDSLEDAFIEVVNHAKRLP